MKALVHDGREAHWKELENLCTALEHRRAKRIGAPGIIRFGELYRAACADLALAEANRLSPATVHYLHQLVARAHNQLYRSRQFDLSSWGRILLEEVPQRVCGDRAVQVAFLLFWIVFIGAAALCANESNWPGFAESVIPTAQLDQIEADFSQPIAGRSAQVDTLMVSFYIQHNMSIGLQCFLGGLLVLPGILITLYNAVTLGSIFGYMARPEVDAGTNFFEFVVAHGPFELTAIVLSAAAGLRLGLAWIDTKGLTRADSLRQTATDVMPLMGAALVMFFFAALIEGFVSPSNLPYFVKASVGMISSGLLTAYFIILGFPRETRDAT